MNKPRVRVSIILSIIFILIGVFLNIFVNLFSPDKILENGGEEIEAYVLYSDSDNTSTTVQITDKNSFYYDEEITVSQYSSNAKTGDYITVYYDGETLMLKDLKLIADVFGIARNILFIVAGILIAISILKWLIFAFKVLVLGVAVGSVANEVKTQENFNNQFYGNPNGRTVNPYEQQNNYSQQMYNQQYNNQQVYNQQNYPQNYNPNNQQYQPNSFNNYNPQ